MSQPQRIAHLARRLTARGDLIARHLIARQPGDPLEVRRPVSVGRTTGVSRPTERALIEWETVQQRDARQLARLLTGHPDLADLHNVLGGMQIAEHLHEPVDRTYHVNGRRRSITQLVGTAADGDPTSKQWRDSVAALGALWHVTAESIHDGWTALYRARWIRGASGEPLLDQTVEDHALAWIGHIGRLERQLAALERRLTPAKLRVCTCGCRGPLDPDERGPVRDVCRKRRSRAKQKEQIQ